MGLKLAQFDGTEGLMNTLGYVQNQLQGKVSFNTSTNQLEITVPIRLNVTGGSDNSELASKDYVEDRIQNLIGTVPSTLDTLQEIVAAINNDPQVYQTLLIEIGKKVTKASSDHISTLGKTGANLVMTKGDNSTNSVFIEPKASTTAPTSPVNNQLWFDSTNNVIKYYNGSSWVTFGAVYNS